MYITPVSLMRDGTEGCPCQSMLLKWGTLEGGGLFVKVLFNHFAVEESAILRAEEGDNPTYELEYVVEGLARLSLLLVEVHAVMLT